MINLARLAIGKRAEQGLKRQVIAALLLAQQVVRLRLGVH